MASQLSAMRSDYNSESRGQNQTLQLFKPLLTAAVAAHAASSIPAAFQLADYGCSVGLNSSDAVAHLISELRAKYADDFHQRRLQFSVVLNDLPRNDWAQLMTFLHSDECSFIYRYADVFEMCSSGSFYEQVLPDGTLQLGISSASLHWCSRLPVEMESHCVSLFASESERSLFKGLAAEDLARFMRARARELVSGGTLVVNFLTPNQSGDVIYQELYTAAVALSEGGLIDRDELRRFNLRLYFRTLDEATDPSLYEPNGLELLVAKTLPQVETVFYRDYLAHLDLDRYAKELSGCVSAFVEPSFVEALSPDRSAAEVTTVCAQLWKAYKARIRVKPDLFSNSWRLIGLVVRKV